MNTTSIFARLLRGRYDCERLVIFDLAAPRLELARGQPSHYSTCANVR